MENSYTVAHVVVREGFVHAARRRWVGRECRASVHVWNYIFFITFSVFSEPRERKEIFQPRAGKILQTQGRKVDPWAEKCEKTLKVMKNRILTAFRVILGAKKGSLGLFHCLNSRF